MTSMGGTFRHAKWRAVRPLSPRCSAAARTSWAEWVLSHSRTGCQLLYASVLDSSVSLGALARAHSRLSSITSSTPLTAADGSCIAPLAKDSSPMLW